MPLNGRTAQKGRAPLASAMFANGKEFQIMQMHRHFARSSLLSGKGTWAVKELEDSLGTTCNTLQTTDSTRYALWANKTINLWEIFKVFSNFNHAGSCNTLAYCEYSLFPHVVYIDLLKNVKNYKSMIS